MDTTTQKTQAVTLTVYDSAMCCSTGVCGPDVDDKLVDFANDVKWLKSQGVVVQRHNLGQEPEAFKSNPEVISQLQAEGSDILPILSIDGSIALKRKYPNREELIDLLDIEAEKKDKQDLSGALEQAVVIGDLKQMREQFKLGEKSGISKEELTNVIQEGVNQRQQLTKKAVETANELLGVSSNGCSPGSGCC